MPTATRHGFGSLLFAICVACGGDAKGAPVAPPVTPPVTPPAPEPVATVTVAPSSTTLAAGTRTELSATLLDAAGRALAGRTVAWASSASNIAEVTAGTVTAIAIGSATISAASEGKTGTATVVVVLGAAAIRLTPLAKPLVAGASVALDAALLDSVGAVIAGRTPTWSSSAPDVAVISAGGRLTAVGPGMARVTASADGKSATIVVGVLEKLNQLVGANRVLVLAPGDTITPWKTTSTTPSDQQYLSRQPLAATVSSTGQVTAIARGAVWVVARSASTGLDDSVFVNVLRNATDPVLRTSLPSYSCKDQEVITVKVLLDVRDSTTMGAISGLLENPTSVYLQDATPSSQSPTTILQPDASYNSLGFASVAPNGAIGTVELFRARFMCVAQPPGFAKGLWAFSVTGYYDAEGHSLLPRLDATVSPILVQ